MAMQKFKMFVVVGVGKWNHGQVTLTTFRPSEDAAGGISEDFAVRFLSEAEVEVDVPEFDLVLLEVDALEKAVLKEKADSQVRVNILLDRLSKLKAIGHDAPVNS
jgi:hypothetical protein